MAYTSILKRRMSIKVLDSLDAEQKVALLSAPDKDKWTPLHHHTIDGAVETDFLQMMFNDFSPVQKMSILMLQTMKGETPIHLAAEHNFNHRVMQIMLSGLHQVDKLNLLKIKDKQGRTPIHSAAMNNENPDVIDILLSGLGNSENILAFVSMHDDYKWTPVQLAAKYNNNSESMHSMVGLLSMDRKIALLGTMRTPDGNSALHLAIQYNQCAMIETMLECLTQHSIRKLLRMRNNAKRTPIEVNSSFPSTVKTLLTKLDTEERVLALTTSDHDLVTPVHWAAANNRHLMRIMLESLNVEHRVEVLSMQAHDGKTPMEIALFCLRKNGDSSPINEVMDSLFGEKTADILMVSASKTGNTLLHTIMESNTSQEIIRRLFEEIDNSEMIQAVPGHAKRSLLSLPDDERRTPVHLAAKLSSSPEIIQKMFQGVDIGEIVSLLRQTTKEKQTPLHLAAQFNENHNVVEQLLCKIPDEMLMDILSQTDEKNLTVIHVAARYTNQEVLRVILERIPPDQTLDIYQSAVNEGGYTPIHMAQFNRSELVTHTLGEAIPEFLSSIRMESKTILNMRDKESLAAIHLAATYSDNPDALRLLMAMGRDYSYELETDAKGWLPIHFAAKNNGNVSVMEILYCDELLDFQADDKWTPIQLAARYNASYKVMRFMLSDRRNKALLNLLSKATGDASLPLSNYVSPPVHLAATCNCSSVMRVLMESLDENQRLELLYQKDKDNRAPLHLAAEYNEDEDVIAAMLEGLTIENALSLLQLENKEGLNPLQMASKHNQNAAVVRVMLAKFDTLETKKSLLSKGKGGLGTPIHLAVSYNVNTAVLKALLTSMDHYAKIELLELKNIDSITPLDLVIRHKNNYHINAILGTCPSKAARVMLINHANKMGVAGRAASKGNAAFLIEILSHLTVSEKEVFHTEQTESGWTSLHFAAQCENAYVMDALLAGLNSDKRKTVLSQTTRDGWSPFHLAAHNNSADVWNALLKAFRSEDHLISMLSMMTDDRFSPVALAFSNGYVSAMKELEPGILLPLIITAKDSDRNSQMVTMLESLISIKEDYFISLQDYLGNTKGLEKCAELLTPVLDSLSTVIERKHHVTRWKDTYGNNLLHIAAAADHRAFITRVIQTQDMTEISDALMKRNSGGLTPYDSCKSGQLPNMLAWAEQQRKSYPLLRPPRVLIFCSDNDRPGYDAELCSLMDVLPSIDVIEPVVKLNPTKLDIFRMIRENQVGEVSALVVVIMSHGDSGVVTLKDGNMELQEVVMQMNSSQLKDVPKILVLQACQTAQMTSSDDQDQVEEENLFHYGFEIDAAPPPSQQIHRRPRTNRSLPGNFHISGPDMFVLAATINNQLASRNFMIPKLAHNIRESSIGADLHDIFLQTTDEVRREVPAQVPEYRSTARLKICLKQVYSPKTKYKSDAKLGLWDRFLKTMK